MGNYYLRVEAVNLGNSVYDTGDISTIRGGSFLLLDAVNELANSLKFLEKLSTGASTGLFLIQNGTSPRDAENEVRAFLWEKTGGHATFVVNSIDAGSMSFKEIHESLFAANRWSQFQELTIPWRGGWKASEGPCALDGVRPGTEAVKFPEGDVKKLSPPVLFRRQMGQKLRNNIYARILKRNPKSLPAFTDNLEDLSEDPDQGNLNGKIAYIYIDGNKFGSIRDTFCLSENFLKDFDRAVQEEFRAPLLERLITSMETDSVSKTGENKLRLETLLWGGDEIEWVVPAWKAWHVLRIFYEFNPPPELKDAGIPLTHTAGVVFCHHNAPILQIRKMAHDLVDLAKSTISGIPDTREKGDIIQYLILESFDMIEGNIKAFFPDYYRPAAHTDFLIRGQDLKRIAELMESLRSYFPHGKVYEIIEAVRKGQDVGPIRDRGISDCPAAAKSVLQSALDGILGGNPGRWLMIADLWDYAKEV
ncbi:MAG: hypothetical protein C4530_09185 [Desulfobacteraceae bacterium]|nr:MAG: hypothetical protein C4530_09185 [Desulfobacteraceae bacterium]